VLEQLEWGDHLIRQSGKGSFRNPPGFYVHLVRENIVPPVTFSRSRNNCIQPPTLAPGQEAGAPTRAELQLGYEEYRREQAERYIATKLPPGEFDRAVREKKAELAKKYKSLLPAVLDEIACQAVRSDIAGQIPLKTFEEFFRKIS
jgi:hypothetical protein